MRKIVYVNFSFILFLVVSLTVVLIACKKKSKSETINESEIVQPIVNNEDTAFKTFMKFGDFVPAGYDVRSMTYDANSKNLFFYAKKTTLNGYAILQLNTVTKQAITVFDSNDPNWLNGNGSEGRRIRVVGNDLYVMGGANNSIVHRLSGVSNNGLTLASSIAIPSGMGGSPYDMAIKSSTIYVINMSNKIVYGNLTLSNAAAYSISNTTHGASIASVNNNLVCSNGSTSPAALELRSSTTGAFIRSTPLKAGTSASLEVDLNNRIVLVQPDKIVRYSSDLLSKEEFKAIGGQDYYQIGIGSEGDRTRVYIIASTNNIEVQSMTIKNE
jgi:hypothetical protein